MTGRKPFAASVQAPLPGDAEPHAGPTDELGYPLDEPAPAVITGDDRFPEDVNLLVTALGCIGFTGILVLTHGVIYGEQISRLDLTVDWTILQAGTGRRLAVIKYDLSPREGTWVQWRARATVLQTAIVFLERGGAGRQETWDRICTALEGAGLGVPPSVPPGDELRPPKRSEQPAEQRGQQQKVLETPAENALATQRGDAAAGSTPWGHARERDELDQLITLAKGPATPLPPSRAGQADRAGRTLRISDDPDAKSRAGRDLARRRWGRRGS